MPLPSIGSLTQYGEQAFLNAGTGNGGLSISFPLWLALYTVSPTDVTAGTEVSGGAYVRQPIYFTSASGSPALSTSTNAILYPASGGATAIWGTVTGFALLNGPGSSTQQIWWGYLSTPRTINIGDSLAFAIGAVQITMD